MNHSETIGKLAEALSKAQGSFTHVEKDGRSHHGKYATLPAVLDTVREGLAQNGLSIVQAPSSEGNAVSVTTRLMHVSGEWLETTISAPAATDIQKLGSSISYLRRYSLMAVLALAADDDDDGNTAMRPQKGPQQPRQTAPRPSAPPAHTPAPAKPASGPTLSTGQAQQLHARLGAMLKGSRWDGMDKEFASEVLGFKVGSFTDLTVAEAKRVQDAAEAEPKEDAA